jgi:hypothetical protein
MKVFATLLLSVSLQSPLRIPQLQTSAEHVASNRPARKGGRWYFAESGHAVYCYGPVRVMPQAEGGLQRVATFCQGDKNMVPLKD